MSEEICNIPIYLTFEQNIQDVFDILQADLRWLLFHASAGLHQALQSIRAADPLSKVPSTDTL